MLKIYQQTLNKTVTFKGIGLHSGKISSVKILPGQSDKGIVFKRIDLKKNNEIQANFKFVVQGKLCTSLENDFGAKVSTVEHLLAAFYISEIDNAIVEIDNEEVPIMDGSSRDFIKFLEDAGLKQLNRKRRYLKIIEKTEFEDHGKYISIQESKNDFEVGFQLSYKNKLIGNQKNMINFSKDNLDSIYQSRTFCLFEDIEKIKKLGLAKGGSLDNAVVIKDEQILNENGLRNKKEFVNHKILDLSGDFFLSGFRILGKVNCFQGGHQLSNIFLRKLFNNKSSFKVIQLDEILVPNKNIVFKPVKAAVNA